MSATTLPHQSRTRFIADGGLETTLMFHEGVELEYVAAFPLLDTEDGVAHLTAYFDTYFGIARRDGVGLVLDTPTWRANPDWGTRLGYDAAALDDINRRAVAFVKARAAAHPDVVTVTEGVIGTRGDGYVVGETMEPAEAARYHAPQIRAFVDTGIDFVAAITMTHAEETIGIVRAAQDTGVPVVVSFTVETDGRLPSGTSLADAITAVDIATDRGPAYYMINCAHPTHFTGALEPGGWLGRIKGIRANSSKMSHAELDEAPELDRGDPDDLAREYAALDDLLGGLAVAGGCCGTDSEHVSVISATLASRTRVEA
ncbi:MAG: homocysteine S-methyltransferase family protein [Thermoleophilia bacterium]|nr:homocysteine S-methyltransferase family protein [Thermoleophilia bacterium]